MSTSFLLQTSCSTAQKLYLNSDFSFLVVQNLMNDSIYIKFQKMQTNPQWLLGNRGLGKCKRDGLQSGTRINGGVYGYVHYLDCGNAFMMYTYIKTQQLHTLNMCSLLYVNYTSMKLKKKIKKKQLGNNSQPTGKSMEVQIYSPCPHRFLSSL